MLVTYNKNCHTIGKKRTKVTKITEVDNDHDVHLCNSTAASHGDGPKKGFHGFMKSFLGPMKSRISWLA